MRELVAELRNLVSDVYSIITSAERIKGLWRHPLYSNAAYIMSAKATDAIVGLVFWILAARLYETGEVGQASSLLSTTSLLAMLSGLGFGYGLIRFLGEKNNPVVLINSTFTLVSLVAAAAVVLFLIGPGLWSPAVVALKTEPAYLLVFMLVTPMAAVAVLADNIFIARRAARYLLARNVCFNLLRVVLPVALAAYLHAFGLFASWGVAVIASVVFSLFFLLPRAQAGYRFVPSVDYRAVGSMFRFSFANYLCDVFSSAPILILQSILIANRLGVENNAYFAVAWAMGSVLSALPTAVALSLFAEGSHDETSLVRSVRQSLKMTFLILTPLATVVLIMADRILLVFRSEYAESAATLLRLFVISAFPVAINSLYFGVKRVKRDMTVVVVLIGLAGAATLGLSYLLMPSMGITGAGVAWLTSQSCVALFVLIDLVRGSGKA